MTILPKGPLTVNVRRSGGLTGQVFESRRIAEPGSPAHDAAVALVHAGLEPGATSRARDAYSYVVTIVDDEGNEVLHTRFRDPVPEPVAALLDAVGHDGSDRWAG